MDFQDRPGPKKKQEGTGQQSAKRLRTFLGETSFEELRLLRSLSPTLMLIKAVEAFVVTNSWSESKQLVIECSELLTDEADTLLANLIDQQREGRTREILKEKRQLLARCRVEGIDEVFEVSEKVDIERLKRFLIVRLQSLPGTAEGTEQKIAICKDILHTLEKHEDPVFWSAVQVHLGLALRARIRGDRADNLEQSIAAFNAALEVRTRDDLPIEWAETQNSLGNSLAQRIRGDRADNLERAITAFNTAMEVFTRIDFPESWAMVQHNLGIAYIHRIQGDRAENLERAIAIYQAVLEVRTREKHSLDWAASQDELGNALQERIMGDHEENLQRAIAAHTKALEVYTRDDFPADWAKSQNNLGGAFLKCVWILSDPVKNLERAIAAFRNAILVNHELGIRNEERKAIDNLNNLYNSLNLSPTDETLFTTMPVLEAMRTGYFSMELLAKKPELRPTMEQLILHISRLGAEWDQAPPEAQQIRSQLSQLVTDSRQERQRLWALEHVLTLVDRQQSPYLWAALQNDLAVSLVHNQSGDRSENLERAIAACTAALEVRTQADFPWDWAGTQLNLGATYRIRIRGDRAENLEQAIAAYTAVLEVMTRAYFPLHWAGTQNNLGAVYAQRIRGDRAENLEQAITAYTAALEVYRRDDFPIDWAMTQINLGAAYAKRIWGDRAENLEQAIAACTAALAVYTRADLPVQWAGTQNGLGTAYADRIRGDRAENLEQAIAAYTAALEVYTRDDFPVDWARIQNNLGNALRERIRGDRAENLEQAIAAYTAALEVRTRTNLPVEWAMTQISLGLAYADRIRGDRAENLERSIAAYQTAIDGAQAMNIREYECGAAHSLGNLHYGEGQWSPAHAAFDTAIAALEATRTSYFSEESKAHLAQENAQLYACMTDTCLYLGRPQEALERAEAGKGRSFLDQLGTGEFPVPSLPSTQQQLLEEEMDLVNELRGLEHAIRNAPDEARRRRFVAQQGKKRAALDEVWAQLEPHAPDYVALRQGDPVKYDDLQALVDGFGPAAALVEFYILPDKIIVFVLRSGEQEPAVAQVSMSPNKVLRHMDNYWREVMDYRQRGDIGQRWQELAEPLLADVLPHLEGAELVYLVPHGPLHYLPLHALQVHGSYLIDRFPIAYAPSAAVLGRVIQRTAGMERSDNGRRALVMGYTPHERERAVFEGEAVQVAEFFGTEAHLGQEATGGLLREEGAQYDTLHLSCHGFFDPTDPMASGLQLADGVLTARDIMGLKLNADLVTLSACQTALSDHQPGDELVGLTRALLYAGASSVLVTLWSVDAVAALELMGDLYARLRGKDGAKVTAEAMSLREAMLEMRKEREHPYYWAPFILVGDWR